MTIKLLEITDEALEQYRSQVNGNAYTTKEQAVKKLTRNYILVRDYAPERINRKLFSKVYSYGNLDMEIRFGKIIKIENHRGRPQDNWHPNKQEYIRLCKLLGIEDNKYTVKVHKKAR